MTAPPPTFDPAAPVTLLAAGAALALTASDGLVLFTMGFLAGAVALAMLLLALDPTPPDDEDRERRR